MLLKREEKQNCEECQLEVQDLKKCECQKVPSYKLLRTRMMCGQCKCLQDIMKRISNASDLKCIQKSAN